MGIVFVSAEPEVHQNSHQALRTSRSSSPPRYPTYRPRLRKRHERSQRMLVQEHSVLLSERTHSRARWRFTSVRRDSYVIYVQVFGLYMGRGGRYTCLGFLGRRHALNDRFEQGGDTRRLCESARLKRALVVNMHSGQEVGNLTGESSPMTDMVMHGLRLTTTFKERERHRRSSDNVPTMILDKFDGIREPDPWFVTSDIMVLGKRKE